MKNKRGQIFPISALVVSLFLIGLAGVYTSTQAPKEDLVVYDLSSEFNYEAAQLISQAIYTNLDSAQLSTQLNALTQYYVNENPGNDFIVISGNRDVITVTQYTWNSGGISLHFGGSTSGLNQDSPTKNTYTITPSQTSNADGGRVTINITDEISQTFNLAPGQNFYSIIKKVSGEQTYVTIGGTAEGNPDSQNSLSQTNSPNAGTPENSVTGSGGEENSNSETSSG